MTTRILTTLGAAALLAWPGSAAGQDVTMAAQGAKVWAQNCVRCHNVRPSDERTDAEWRIIVNHMRARANLTKTQARVVTAFMQQTNTPVAAPAPDPAPATAPVEPEPEAKPGGGEIPIATLQRLQAYVVRLAGLALTPSS